MATLDTPEAISELYRAMLMKCSGAARVKMACGMFALSRQFILAGAGNRTGVELKIYLFQRTYGGDFDPATAQRIIQWFRDKG